MARPTKTPPRFVPTLTEVVQVDGLCWAPHPGALFVPAIASAPPTIPAPGGSSAASALPLPGSPAVGAQAHPHAPCITPLVAGVSSFGLTGHVPMAPSAPAGMEEHLVRCVLQRVDAVLDQRLREAIAKVIDEQTLLVTRRLREEIDAVVRHAVYEAVADELISGAPPIAEE